MNSNVISIEGEGEREGEERERIKREKKTERELLETTTKFINDL